MKRIIKFLVRFGQRRIRYKWSRLYRWAFERKYDVKIPPMSLRKVTDFLSGCLWVADPWYMGFDVVSLPGKMFWAKQDDCDGFAIFACAALKEEHLEVSGILTVSMFPLERSHSVCLFKYKDRYWHISNGNQSKPFGPYDTKADVVNSILNYKDRKSELIAWDLVTPDLKHFINFKTSV